ncbi:uncharacterized protein LOC106644942 [Copidosoma floridanum]|uniref:uncharacterized protein LOC106644942 n=1 Tax=Copidosoma floridanum TaxID=29053 RepID=UPI0006C96746|nr:uncharacterized protein LOC106644942 [Copidosoma floridanum]
MDAYQLIAEIFKRPALWNQKHVSYHNREVTNQVWMEISSLFKMPVPVLKAKWKGLRDTFRAELKKEQVCGKNKHQRNRPVWIHFESLQFLKEQMVPRPSLWEHNNGNNVDYNKNHENGSTTNDSGDCQRSFSDSLSEHIVARSTEHAANQDKNLKDESIPQRQVNFPVNESDEGEIMLQNISPEDVLLNATSNTNGLGMNGEGDSNSSISIPPIERFSSHHCDDNYYFFISLLPHMRQLTPERRMFLRMKIQELVYEEVYKKNMNS